MRSTEENETIHDLATALLKRRGIQPTSATFAEYADAAEVAAEAVEQGKTAVAEMLAVAAIGDTTPDEPTQRLLATFATDGRFVSDLSLDERDLLEAAITAEQRRDVIAADAAGVDDGNGYCVGCGYHLRDHGCRCA